MKNLVILICLLTFSIFSNFAISQNADTSKYKKILPYHYNLDSNFVFVENDSSVFTGYFILKYTQDNDMLVKKNANFVNFDFIFVKELKDLRDKDRIYYSMSDYYSYLLYATQDENPLLDTNENTLKIINLIKSKEYHDFKKIFFKYFDYRNNKELASEIFLQRVLETNILEKSEVLFFNYGDEKSIGYFIFNCSFSTAILKFKAYRVVGKDSEENPIKIQMGLIKVLLPISPLIYFKPIEENECLENGFKKASWFPDCLSKKY